MFVLGFGIGPIEIIVLLILLAALIGTPVAIILSSSNRKMREMAMHEEIRRLREEIYRLQQRP